VFKNVAFCISWQSWWNAVQRSVLEQKKWWKSVPLFLYLIIPLTKLIPDRVKKASFQSCLTYFTFFAFASFSCFLSSLLSHSYFFTFLSLTSAYMYENILNMDPKLVKGSQQIPTHICKLNKNPNILEFQLEYAYWSTPNSN
jgi:hypothetical protein